MTTWKPEDAKAEAARVYTRTCPQHRQPRPAGELDENRPGKYGENILRRATRDELGQLVRATMRKAGR